jgi:hypothetical protein
MYKFDFMYVFADFGCRNHLFGLTADGASNQTHVGEQFKNSTGEPAPVLQLHCVAHRGMLVMGTVLDMVQSVVKQAKQIVKSIKKSTKRTAMYVPLGTVVQLC